MSHARTAKGIYKDAYGYEVRARANGVLRIKRFPPDTPLRTMRDWQENERATIRRDRPAPSRGTLAADAVTYLKRVEGMTSYRDRKLHIDWWVAQLGHRRRDSIRAKDIQAALDTLDVSPSTHNHYRTALAHLWRVIDGPNAHSPVKDVPKRTEAPGVPRAIPDAVLDQILAALPKTGSASVARILVMAETGFSPAMIKMLTPDDVNLDAATVRAPARHKGAGVAARMLPLTDRAVLAFKAFIAANAWGEFSTHSLRKTWLVAVKACNLTETGLRMYDLRHTFLTRALVATGGNLRVVQALAQHASSTTTQRYTLAAVPTMLQDAITAMNEAKATVN